MLSLLSTVAVFVTQRLDAAGRPELTLAISAANHAEAYREAAAAFEKSHHVRVSVELMHARALQTRLQNAMLAKSPVPDLVPVVLNLYLGLYRADYGIFLAGTLIAILPPAMLFFALEKEFIGGLTSGAVKG